MLDPETTPPDQRPLKQGMEEVVVPPRRVPPRTPERHPVVTVGTFVSGFLAVMLLGVGAAIWLLGLNVTFNFGIDQWGIKKNVTLHKSGCSAVLLGLGVWFALLTRGLWQQRRYGRIMGIVTVVVVVLIAILLKLS